METITLKDHPKIAALVRPFSRKHRAFLRRRPAVALDGTCWDGGSRSVYYLVHIDSRHAETLPASSPPQFGGPAAVPTKAIALGYAIVEVGTFCGKPSTPTVYLHPDQQM